MKVKKTSMARILFAILFVLTIYLLYEEVAFGFIDDSVSILTMGPFVFFQSISVSLIGLFVSLIIILFTSDKHLLVCFSFFKNFKKIRELSIVFFVDLIFFGVLYFILMRALEIFKETTAKHLGSEQAILNDPSIVVSYFQSVSLLVVGLLFVLFILYTLSRGIIWKILVGKDFSLKYFADFFKINFVWCLLWFVPLIIIFLGLTPQFKFIGMIYSLIVFSYFSGALHYSVASEKNVLKTFGILSIGFFTYLLTPYSLMYAGYAVLAKIIEQFPFYEYSSYILFILMMACLRVYLAGIFDELSRKK